VAHRNGARQHRVTKSWIEKADIATFTRHDLRRTGATTLQRLGVADPIITTALNHAMVSGAARHYLHAGGFSLWEERKEALGKLGDYYDRLR
jgi:integrase